MEDIPGIFFRDKTSCRIITGINWLSMHIHRQAGSYTHISSTHRDANMYAYTCSVVIYKGWTGGVQCVRVSCWEVVTFFSFLTYVIHEHGFK